MRILLRTILLVALLLPVASRLNGQLPPATGELAMTARTFQIRFSSGKSLDLSTFFTADGKLAQCMVVQ
jgi:hypothetical protein